MLIDFCLIFVPFGHYDEPEILRYAITSICPKGARGQTQGLGVIGSNQTGALARGLHLHTTLAVNPEGVPLGVLRAGFDAPPPPHPDAKGPKAREEKKSFRWIEGLRDCAQAAQRLPETRVVYTTDRASRWRCRVGWRSCCCWWPAEVVAVVNPVFLRAIVRRLCNPSPNGIRPWLLRRGRP